MPLNPTHSTSPKQPQSKRAIFGSYFNQLTDFTNLNNLRQIQATYDPRQAPETLKLQLLIKAQKGLVIDSEALGRDSHMVSKQLYLWACEQPDRALQDVGDRLAYMTYQVGDLQQQCSKDLERARVDLKEIRNFENDIIKLRERDKILQNQIHKTLQDPRHNKHESKEKLSLMTAEHSSVVEKLKELERSTPIQRRKLIQSSYHTQFRALREMADKLLIITQFGDLLLDELDQDPQLDYAGQDHTALIKGAASQALQDYSGPVFSKPNIGLAHDSLNQSSSSSGASLHRADTRLFGETHPHVLTDAPDDLHLGHTQVGSSSPSTSSYSTPHGKMNVGGSGLNNSPINHQPASIPKPSIIGDITQPPKLPSRPSETGKPFNLSNTSSNSYGNFPTAMNATYDPSKPPSTMSDYKPPIDQVPPTVAEVGDHIPTSTNGPSHGSLDPPHQIDQPPAYSPNSEKS